MKVKPGPFHKLNSMEWGHFDPVLKGWDDESLWPSWACLECRSPVRGTQAVDALVVRDSEPPSPKSFDAFSGTTLLRRDFLTAFGMENIERDLWVGKVFDEKNVEIEHWATVRPRVERFIRYSSEVTCHSCPGCRRIRYWGRGRPYFCPPPAPGVGILTDGFWLVVTREIAFLLNRTRWPKIYLEPVYVRDTPLDGFPIEMKSLWDNYANGW
jgi:hypothetical protein